MNCLVLSNLNNTVLPEKSAGRALRSYRYGDWKAWEELSSRPFDEVQRKNPLYKPEFVFFLLEGEKPVATASLRRDPAYAAYGVRLTELHVRQGNDEQELLRSLCVSVLKTVSRIAEQGVWANGESGAANTVLKQLGFVEQELTPREFARDHTDYSKRIKPLYRWHTDRMIGESTGDTGDARGDESLYKPGTLGQAGCSITSVEAGADRPFELYYTAGETPIVAGMTVKFWMAGQGSLGTAPQILDPGFPGFAEFVTPRSIEIEPLCAKPRIFNMETGEEPKGGLAEGDLIVGPITLGFTVTRGKLQKGETVRISLGREHGFPWKKLAGRKEFKVLIEPGRGEPRMRLPGPVAITILPGKPEFIELFLPGSAARGGESKGGRFRPRSIRKQSAAKRQNRHHYKRS